MKDPQDPDDDGLDPASQEPSGDTSEGTVSSSAPQPLVGPDSPRCLDVEPDSPMAVVASIARMSTGARIAELQAVAGLFLAEVIDRLRCAPEGELFRHATFTETVDRFIAVRDGDKASQLDEQVDPWLSPDSAVEDTDSDSADADPTNEDSADTDVTGEDSADHDSAGGKAVAQSLPNFPKFRLGRSFNSWAHEFAVKEDVAELTAVLGTTIEGAYAEITNAITLVFGLPKFLDRCLNGEFTIEHVLVAARAVKDVEFEYVPRLDSYLGQRRADITIETFRKSLNLKIAALVPVEDRLEVASKRRRVEITTYPDGTASVQLSGPAVELQAFVLRLEAFARAIRRGSISAFTDEDLSGVDVGEQDSIAALMFDIATRATPQMAIAVTAHDTTTGETSTKEISLDSVEAGDPMVPVSAAAVDQVARRAGQEAERTAGEGVEVTSVIKLIMPTHGQWIREQAKLMVTVPYLTAVGHSELPGTFSDGAPVPHSAAKALAGESTTWHRILTDPATGTPIDARSKSYHIPADVRTPLTAKWQSCSVPGCIRRAETSEIDHIIPFDHGDPAHGGQTTFSNLGPLCKAHHMAKTDRKFSIRRIEDGGVEYAFARDVNVKVYPPDNPINAEHARQVDNCARLQNYPSAEGRFDQSTDTDSTDADNTDTDSTEIENTDTAGGSVLRFTSESDTVADDGQRTGRETPQARRSRETQESIWNVNWDPEDPPPF